MVKKIVSKAEFARMAGVSHAAITKAIKNDLGAAMNGHRVDANHPAAVDYLKIHAVDDLYDQAVKSCMKDKVFSVGYLRRTFPIGAARAKQLLESMHRNGVMDEYVDGRSKEGRIDKPVVTRGMTAKNEAAKKQPPVDIKLPDDIPEDIRCFADMTLRELGEKFGTDLRLRDWLSALKKMEDVYEKRLKNAQTKGELVSRKMVKLAVIDPVDAAHRKLLTDGSKTIARRVTSMHGSGQSVEDCERFVVDQISSFIKPMKAKIARMLKNV